MSSFSRVPFSAGCLGTRDRGVNVSSVVINTPAAQNPRRFIADNYAPSLDLQIEVSRDTCARLGSSSVRRTSTLPAAFSWFSDSRTATWKFVVLAEVENYVNDSRLVASTALVNRFWII